MTETEKKHEHSHNELVDGGKVMSVFDHLDELRARLIRSIWGVGIVFVIAFYYSNEIFEILKIPLLQALPEGTTTRQALHFTDPMDVFMMSIRVSILAAVVLGSPLWLFQFWKFFEPALYPNERKLILPFVIFSVLFFLVGMAFCYFTMLPMSLKYLIGLGIQVGTPIITITDYMSLVTILFLGSGAIFETPLVLILLSLLGVLTADMLIEYRKLTIVIILIIAAIITPSPDPFSQIVLALPMYLMFEGSIIVIKSLEKRKLKVQ